jgi:hypothetical protein
MTPSLFLATLLAAAPGAPAEPIAITDRLFHLGDAEKPDWRDFTTVRPTHGTELELEFEAADNPGKLVLEIQAGSVSEDWKVKLNSRDLGALKKEDARTVQYLSVPAGTLKNGRNRLAIEAGKKGDDIYVGRATLHSRPLRELLGHARVHASVRDADTGQELPSRITLVKQVEKKEKVKDRNGKEREVTKLVEELVTALSDERHDLVVRKGIFYARDGRVTFDVPPGKYTVYATRGFEYGLGRADLELRALEEREVELAIRREVDTTGYLAADTHIHTQTHSGHGDINLEERVVAIAGEGVEIAVATDHNHHTDYRPIMEKVGIDGEFKSVIGNEVTTEIGHFNAFPFEKGADPPDHRHSDWTQLIQEMRASGVRVVIVNHPRRPQGSTSPFEKVRLNPLSGEAHEGPKSLGIDAVEILNGKTLADDRMLTLRDWFGLVNRGHRVAAVAASDSHAVSEIVGQARTYVESSTDDPRRMQIQEICDNILAGRLLVCMGLLTEARVAGGARPGDLITAAGGELAVEIRVQGPSWTQANLVTAYLNGIEIHSEKVEPTPRAVKYAGTWRIPAPPQDAHLVVVATGPAITAPYWPIAGGEKKYVLGATNPIWLDADGDGTFTSAFEYASRLVKENGTGGPAPLRALEAYDRAVAAQFASLARARIEEEAQDAYRQLLSDADRKLEALRGVEDAAIRKSFQDYLAAAPKLEVHTRRETEETAERLKKEAEESEKRKKEAREKRRKERRRRQI